MLNHSLYRLNLKYSDKRLELRPTCDDDVKARRLILYEITECLFKSSMIKMKRVVEGMRQ